MAVGLTLRSLLGCAQSENEQCTWGVLHEGPFFILTEHKCWALFGTVLVAVLLDEATVPWEILRMVDFLFRVVVNRLSVFYILVCLLPTLLIDLLIL